MHSSYQYFSQEKAKRKPTIGISACLLGEKVRYDGKDKRSASLMTRVLPAIEPHAMCPEVAIGLGVPRPRIHLINKTYKIRAVGIDDPEMDVTERLSEFARKYVTMSSAINVKIPICGFIFKSKSPSCGVGSTLIYTEEGVKNNIGNGVFADVIRNQLPWLPLIEESFLNNDNIVRLYLFCTNIVQDWYYALQESPTLDQLRAFHLHHMEQGIGINAISAQQLKDIISTENKFNLSGRDRAFKYLSTLIQDLYYYGSLQTMK